MCEAKHSICLIFIEKKTYRLRNLSIQMKYHGKKSCNYYFIYYYLFIRLYYYNTKNI